MLGWAMLVSTGICRAQDPSIFCTAEGVPKYVTELGDGIDDLIHIPRRLRSEVGSAQKNRWKFQYGTAAFADREKKTVNIIRGASDKNMASQVSHEIGHANYVPHYDNSSRDAYVRSACTDEGRGVLENIYAYKAFKTCAALDVGLITAEPATILAKYEELAQSLPMRPADLGMLFCEKNINSITHQNYLDYYGDWWDANYGKREPVKPADSRDESFLVIVENLANEAASGAADLLAAWPSVMSLEPAAGPDHLLSRRGGGAALSSDRWMGAGEIRTDINDLDRVGIAYFALRGRCLSLAAIKSRYSDLALTGIPQSPLSSETTVWSAFGSWGKLSFVFVNDDPDCVGEISLDPHPAPPPPDVDA
jgi:hypothetical protein